MLFLGITFIFIANHPMYSIPIQLIHSGKESFLQSQSHWSCIWAQPFVFSTIFIICKEEKVWYLIEDSNNSSIRQGLTILFTTMLVTTKAAPVAIQTTLQRGFKKTHALYLLSFTENDS